MELLALVAIVVLIAINASFAGTEFALLSLRSSQVHQLREHGRRGRAVTELVEDPNRYLSAVQVGVTLAGFLASAVSAVVFTGRTAERVGWLGTAAEPTAIVLVTVALVLVTLVFGELVPKRIAMQRARAWSLCAARPLVLVTGALRPVIWLLSRSTDAVVRTIGGDPQRRHEDITRRELGDLVTGLLPPDERKIVVRSLRLAERTLSDLMVPRSEVVSFRHDMASSDAISMLIEAGHSRAPVHDGSLDQVTGTVHVRDLIGTDRVGDAVQPALAVHAATGTVATLRAMQAEHQKLAIVTGTDGATLGIITVEDLVEEIVGEIRDAQEASRASSRPMRGRWPTWDTSSSG